MKWKCLLALACGSAMPHGALVAGPVVVPNSSFESPVTTFVTTYVDFWQKPPKPAWYDESGPFLWDQLAGTFKNTPPTSPDHIDNCDGAQALYLFAIPEVGLFQDYDTMDWDDPAPTHAFDVTYQVGASYQLTVGVIGGGGGNMLAGVTLELSLYYRDAASNQVTVAATTITNSTAVFSNTTHFLDFNVDVPPVQPGDAWAGRHIGVRLLSTVSSNLAGGYWDLDNVRLTTIPPPQILNPHRSNGVFRLSLQSEPGRVLEVLTAGNATLPFSNWASLETVTNTTGLTDFVDTTANLQQRYYRLRQLP